MIKITMPMKIVPRKAIRKYPAPAAMPAARAKNMNTISWVSFTAVRKRMIDIAPTNPKARARLLPITMMTTAVIIASRIIALTKEME